MILSPGADTAARTIGLVPLTLCKKTAALTSYLYDWLTCVRTGMEMLKGNSLPLVRRQRMMKATFSKEVSSLSYYV